MPPSVIEIVVTEQVVRTWRLAPQDLTRHGLPGDAASLLDMDVDTLTNLLDRVRIYDLQVTEREVTVNAT